MGGADGAAGRGQTRAAVRRQKGVGGLAARSGSGRTCRVISRAPGLKLVVETLISSLRPIGNIVLICCAFFIIFGILGVQVRALLARGGPAVAGGL